jgi:phage N-6-adenine-methyltransferase
MSTTAMLLNGKKGTCGLGERPLWWTTDHWETPPHIIAELEKEFGTFDLDAAANAENAKAAKFFTAEDDGLSQPWFGRVWCNPPYSNPKPWCQKAVEESKRGCFVVMLLPVCTDTSWFQDFVLPNATLRFIRGRVRFHGWMGTPIGRPTSPSMLALFGTP